MLDPLGSEKTFGFLHTSMNLASIRQEVLSGNLANVDTPGYRARDIQFTDVMKEYMDQDRMRPSYRVEGGQILPPAPLNFHDFPVEERVDSITERKDGNNVDIDIESAKLAENSGKFKMATSFMNRKIRLINDIIRT